jgi:SAM-dependent methyltransferase
MGVSDFLPLRGFQRIHAPHIRRSYDRGTRLTPSTKDTARFYDALSSGGVTRGLLGLESRFDAGKIARSESVDRHFRRVVRRFVGASTRVLDIGCGPGGFTAVLAETAQEVVGIDISESWVASACRMFEEKRLPARAAVGSGAALPFADCSFDVVMLLDVIHHLDDPPRTLHEARRVLRPGGYLLVFEPNKLNPALAILGLIDRNEWGFLRRGIGTMRGYRRLLEPLFRLEDMRYSGLLIGPDGPQARRIADTLSEGAGASLAGWLSPKIFVVATKRG